MGARNKEIDGRILKRRNGIVVEQDILDSLNIGKWEKMGMGEG